MSIKVVHVLSSLKVGGAERFVLDLSEVQRSQGCSVEIFSCDASGEAPLLEEAGSNGDCWRSSGNRWTDYASVCRSFSGYATKAFHVHSPAAIRFFLPLLVFLRLLGVNIVYTRHGIAPLASLKWRLIHCLARPCVNWVTFVSQVGLDTFYQYHHWRKSIHKLVSNGVLVPKAISKTGSPGKVRLGSVGRMVKLKGQSHLIEAVSSLPEQDRAKIELHFFGDGSELQSLQALSEQKVAPAQALFHGMELDRDKVYGEIDILVVCSEQEGLSLAIMEAMARGIPVIATNVGDSPKLVIDDCSGFLYEYADIEKLASLLRSLSNDQSMRELLGEGALAHITENYSLELTNESYQGCYR